MENVHVSVGLDYHRLSIQVCVMDPGGKVLVNRRCPNSAEQVNAAIGPGRVIDRAAIESCCGASDLSEELISSYHWPITMAHPGYVARMKHNPDKSDYTDAKVLADLARAGLVPPVWLAPKAIRELRILVRTRADFMGQIKATKTRILAVLREQRITEPEEFGRWCIKWMAWLLKQAGLSEQGRFTVGLYVEEWQSLKRRVNQVEWRLRQATVNDRVVEKLLSIKGVGPVTAWTMRALIGRFDRFGNGKQLARFCAVTPCNASSGQRQSDSGMIRAGDRQLKCVVIEAAHRLLRYVPRWREFGTRMRTRGKPASVIVGAVANRWLRCLHHEMTEVPIAA